MNDDYYSLLGVDADAATNDIREAYRGKKSALDAKGDKSEVARVNKAWNVLSDPYQRGRYDEQRARGEGTVEVVDGDAVPVPAKATAAGSGAGEPPRRRRFFEPRPREPRPVPVPTIDVPEGRSLAEQKPRMYALAIDIFVMVLILFGLQMAFSDRLTERWYPAEHARISELRDDPPGSDKSELEEAKDKADKSDEAADKAEDDKADNASELRDTADKDKKAYDKLVDEDADLSRKTAPAGIVVLEGAMILCFAYLVIPSARTGQTLGKRLRGVRVVRMDGSPLGWKGAVVRYGPIILAANLLLILLPVFGILGLLLLGGLFFLVLGWMRNANRQAFQDRVAKTLVVDA